MTIQGTLRSRGGGGPAGRFVDGLADGDWPRSRVADAPLSAGRPRGCPPRPPKIQRGFVGNLTTTRRTNLPSSNLTSSDLSLVSSVGGNSFPVNGNNWPPRDGDCQDLPH